MSAPIRLAWQDFGTALLDTEDLDPIYCMLARGDLDQNTLKRWCLAYWMFYHAGVASRIAELAPERFWAGVEQAFTEKWPRGAERRHFRTKQAWAAVEHMRDKFSGPEALVEGLWPNVNGPVPFSILSKQVKRLPQFGPWIAFKVADMFERVLGYHVDFSDCVLSIYREPVKGLALMETGKETGYDSLDIAAALIACQSYFCGRKAPPHYDRALNVQEFETVACKYKSHAHGHYPVGKDSEEIHEGLIGWGDLARQLQRHVPQQYRTWKPLAGTTVKA